MHAPMEGERGAILILGAGVAGLATAYHLQRRWRERPEAVPGGGAPPPVILLESEPHAGGLAASLTRDGVVTDLGPHRLHTDLPEIKALLDEVASEQLVTVTRESHMYWLGRRLRYPISPFELLRRVGAWRTARLTLGAFATKLGVTGAPDDADSFENIMRARFGAPLWDDLLGPYSEKVWKRPGREVHGDTARVRVQAGGIGALLKQVLLRRGEKPGEETVVRTFRYPRGGLQTLVDIMVLKATEGGATLRLGAPVEAVERAEGGGRDGGEGGGEGGGERIRAVEAGGVRYEEPLAVISTIPLPTLGTMLGADVAEPASRLEYLAMLLVVVCVRRERVTRDNWLYFFDPTHASNRAYEPKNFDPSMAPAGRTALTCDITCREGDDLWCADDDALGERVAGELASVGLFARDEVDRTFVHRVRWAYPVYAMDYRERLGAIFARLARIENLLTCGRQGLFNHNNTDHSMAMGMAAADALLTDAVRPAVPWYDGLAGRFRHFRIVD